MNEVIVVTTPELAGFEIVKIMGIVHARANSRSRRGMNDMAS